MIDLTINGTDVQVEHGEILLDVARRIGVEIPALCHHDSVSPYAACRLCLVEVNEGRRTRLVTSCTYPIRFPIVVETHTEQVLKTRRMIFELLLAEAPASPELARLAAEHGVTSTRFTITEPDNACILCGLCQRVCHDVRHVAGISFAHRGTKRKVMAPYDEEPEACDGCTACAFVCPTHAIGVGETGATLNIEPWHASVELVRCERCGEPVGPMRLLEDAAKATDDRTEIAKLCNRCKQLVHATHLVGRGAADA